jgi:hypothetical protein
LKDDPGVLTVGRFLSEIPAYLTAAFIGIGALLPRCLCLIHCCRKLLRGSRSLRSRRIPTQNPLIGKSLIQWPGSNSAAGAGIAE